MSVSELEKNLIQRVCVGDIATRAENHFPNKIAIKDGDTTLTFREFNRQVNRVGHALLNLGLKRQERVAFMFPNTWEMLVCYFACAKAGLVAMPVNLGLKPEEIAYCLMDSEAKVLISHSRYMDGMAKVIPNLKSLKHVVWARLDNKEMVETGIPSTSFDDLLNQGEETEIERMIHDRDDVQLLYTSGTTSNPKGVRTSHVAVNMTGLSAAVSQKADHESVLLAVLPLFHCAMLNAGVVPTFIVCGTIVLSDISNGFDAKETADLIEKEKVTSTALLPMMHQALLALPDAWERDFSSLEKASYAMAPMPLQSLKELDKLYPNADVILGSGQTEFTPPTTYQRKEHKFEKAASWGPATPSVHIEIMDEEGNILPRGQIGEIVYRGPHAMTGYLNLPEETERVFKHGWFHSGDMAWMDEEGVVWFTDRKKDMIKTGGENVASIEVERTLLGHESVQDAAVIGLPHPYWGEAVTAFVILKPDKSVSEDDIISYCKELLAGFKVPKKIIFVDDFPRTGTGKIQKHQIRTTNLELHTKQETL